ncbi:MAG: carboxypeptidase regulatory-like domain-containing protein [Gemmatimonadaceae bacterium]|nr:carboxypeptidase regulatory-like domain-containing protein [Gemmatimonadaceae bacterium]
MRCRASLVKWVFSLQGVAALMIAALAGTPCHLRAQDVAATGLIDGRVRAGPTQQPIANATIRVGGTDFVVVSGDDGRFRLRAPAGIVRLEVRASRICTDRAQ